MNYLRKAAIPLLLFLMILVFFYKTVFGGLVPFPGDLLLSEYKPWQSYSFGGYLPGTIPQKAQYPDTLRQLYPWRTLVNNELTARRLPLWNPYNFSGAPLLANFQSAVFYPLNALYLLLPQSAAWTILVILQPFLALLFTYWYLRKINLSNAPALLGSTSYAFSLFTAVWLEYNTVGHVLLWLPLTLLSVEHLGGVRSRLWFAILIFSLVNAVLAGHPQLAAYFVVFITAYAWFQAREVSALVVLSIVLALGISAIQLIPGIELTQYAARSPHDASFLFQKILIQPLQLLMAAIPNLFGNPAVRTYWPQDTFVGKALYIGIVPLFFLLAAMRVKSSRTMFFAVVAIFILALMTANPLTYVLYRLNIPILSASSPTLLGFLFAFSLSTLASMGLHEWIREKHTIKKLTHRSLMVVVAFIATWLIFKTTGHSAVAQKAILYSAAIAFTVLIGFFVAITQKKLMIPVVLCLLFVNGMDLFIQFQKFNPFVPQAYIYPKTSVFSFLKDHAGIDRFWGYGTASIQANFATQYQLFSPDGYDPLYPRWYGAFIHASKDGNLLDKFTTQTRSDALIAPGFGELDLSGNMYRLRILDTLGVRYILDRPENGSTQKTFSPDRFRLLADVDGWKIYENKQAAPRVFLTDDFRLFRTAQEFNEIFFNEAFHPSKTILLDEAVKGPLRPAEHTSVQVLHYEPSDVAISVNSNGNLLFLSDTYYPGWQARIDGVPTHIYRADYAFRAVYVPEGHHVVRFTFFPFSFKIGLVVSLVSFVITAIVIRRLPTS